MTMNVKINFILQLLNFTNFHAVIYTKILINKSVEIYISKRFFEGVCF